MPRAIVMLGLLFCAGGVSQGDSQKPLDALRGTWALTAVEGEGLPSGVHVGLVFDGDKYHGLRGGAIDERGTITLDASATPMTIDLTISEGKFAGKTQLGLVSLSGDAMTLVLAEPGSPTRPTALSQSPLGLTRLRPLPKALEGQWEGTIDANGKALRMHVKLSTGADGLGTGTLVSFDQGTGKEAPIVAVVQIGSRIALIVPALRGTYNGEVRDGQIAGTWSVGRVTSPLVLQKSEMSRLSR